MSNGVDVQEIAYGGLDVDVPIELYFWTTREGDYDIARQRARFFTMVPDPKFTHGNGGSYQDWPVKIDMEIARVWSTVWEAQDRSHSLQYDLAIVNYGEGQADYRIPMGETDN